MAHISRLCYFFPANVSTSDQRCFNVVDQRWNNVDPTFKMKQNRTLDFQRCKMLKQSQCLTLKQCWYNVDISLFQPSVNVSSNYIESNGASDDYGFTNTWIVFILLHEKSFFTIQLLRNIKNFSYSGAYCNTQWR